MNGGLASAVALDVDEPDELPVLELDPDLPDDEPEELEEPVLELVDEPDELPVLELFELLEEPVLLLVDDPERELVVDPVLVELVVVVVLFDEVESLGTLIVTFTLLADSEYSSASEAVYLAVAVRVLPAAGNSSEGFSHTHPSTPNGTSPTVLAFVGAVIFVAGFVA